MTTIYLPADTEHLYLDEVAHLIADCLNLEGPNDPEGTRYKAALEALTPELEQAATSGTLRTRHPQTLGLLPPVVLSADPVDRFLNGTYSMPLRARVVAVADFAAYVADRGMAVVKESPEQTTQPQTATPAPVVTNQTPLPVFTVQARPLCVPTELETMSATAQIRIIDRIGGGSCEAITTVSDYREILNARIERQSKGYFTVDEAAQVLADTVPGVVAKEMIGQMLAANQMDKLPIRNPGDKLQPLDKTEVRTFIHLVSIEDVNTWLASPPMKAPYRISLSPLLVTVPNQSPRDIKPWEVLVPLYEPIKGLYMYQQAAREIADAEGWNDSQLVALEAEMLWAINDKSLTVRDRETGMERKHDAWEVMKLVTVEDVNTWLEKRRVPYRWTLQVNTPQPQPKQESANEWVSEAQSRAREIIKEQRARDLYSDQLGIADQIAREFRAAGKVGADGKPISGAYIKRHALKGITSAIVKQLSTANRQSK